MKNKVLVDPLKDADFEVELFQLLFRYGLVNETTLRNSIIRKEHREAKLRGERIQDFKIRMSEKYFISEARIDSIIYVRSNSKKDSTGDQDNGC